MTQSICIIDKWGTKRWYLDVKNKILHREGGPAIENKDGAKCWYINNMLHREDGPAVTWFTIDNELRVQWFFNGHFVNCSSQEEFERLIKLKAFW